MTDGGGGDSRVTMCKCRRRSSHSCALSRRPFLARRRRRRRRRGTHFLRAFIGPLPLRRPDHCGPGPEEPVPSRLFLTPCHRRGLRFETSFVRPRRKYHVSLLFPKQRTRVSQSVATAGIFHLPLKRFLNLPVLFDDPLITKANYQGDQHRDNNN